VRYLHDLGSLESEIKIIAVKRLKNPQLECYLVEESLSKVLSVFDRRQNVVKLRLDLCGQNTDSLLDDGFVVQRFSDQELFGVGCVVESGGYSAENKVGFLEHSEGSINLCIHFS